MQQLCVLLFFGFLGSALCSGGGGLGKGDSSGSVITGGSEVSYSGNHIVKEGSEFEVTCTLTLFDQLKWTHNGKRLTPGEGGYTTVEGPGPQGFTQSRLIVVKAKPHHAGEYKCTTFSPRSHSVYVLREVFETDGTVVLHANTPLTLQCNETRINEASIEVEWTKDEEPIEESDHIKIHKHNLTLYIEDPKEKDAGIYKCESVGEVTPTPISQIFKVFALPNVKKLPKSTTVLQGDKLSLLCEASGSPTPSVEWLKDGKPILDQVEQDRLTLTSHEDVEFASVVIQPAEYKDRGNFMCIVSNDVVRRETATFVRVKDIYAALWPFLGIVAEVVILCLIIFIYEKRRAKNEFEESDTDQGPDQKNTADHNKDAVRQRK